MNHPGAARHLAEEDLLPPDDRCRLCGAVGSRRREFRVQDEPAVDWLRCAACRGSSASRMPTPAYLAGYYAEYYKGDGARVTVGRPVALAHHVASLLPPPPSDRVSVLDFGGGDGTVAGLLARVLRGRHGVAEVSIAVVDPAAGSGGYATLDDVPPGRSDVVIASAVLEHVPDCGEVLAALVERLGAGGCLYARTPWRVPFRRLSGRISMDFPMHVHDLGPSFWNRVAGRLPVEVLVSQPSLVASGWTAAELPRTVAAHVLKAPARLEARLRRDPEDYRWRFAGGWEAVLQAA